MRLDWYKGKYKKGELSVWIVENHFVDFGEICAITVIAPNKKAAITFGASQIDTEKNPTWSANHGNWWNRDAEPRAILKCHKIREAPRATKLRVIKKDRLPN